MVLVSFAMSITLALKGFEQKINLAYSALALTYVLKSSFALLHYSTPDLATWLAVHKLINMFLLLFMLSYLFFLAALVHKTNVRLLFANSAWIVAFIIYNVLMPYGFTHFYIDGIVRNPITGSYAPTIEKLDVSVYLLIPGFFSILYYTYSSLRGYFESTKPGYKRFLKWAFGISLFFYLTYLFSFLAKVPFLQLADEFGFIVFMVILVERNIHHILDSSTAKLSLIESEERYRGLIEDSPNLILLVHDGKIIYANRAAKTLLNPDKSKVIDNSLLTDFISIEQFVNFPVLNEATFRPQKSPVIGRMCCLNGKEFDASVLVTLVKFGGLKVFQLVIEDVTERLMRDKLLRNLSQAVESAYLGVVITDNQGFIEYVNPHFTKVYGYSLQEVLGKKTSALGSGFHDEAFYSTLWSTVISGRSWKGEFLNFKKNGEAFWEQNFISPVVDSEGNITHYIAIKEDVTEHKAMVGELLESKEKIEKADTLKSTLLANVSHEFRTPLNGILGFSQILKEDLTDEEQIRFAERIERSGIRLKTTLNSLLLIMDLQSNNYKFVPTILTLSNILESIDEHFRSTATEKHLEFEIINNSKLSTLKSDELFISNCLIALVDNALKYTTKGKITLEIENYLDAEKEEQMLRFKVSDTGIGIDKEHFEYIFQDFRQISQGFKRAYEGLGLGLTIVRRLARLAGGNITVESELNVGSTFTLTFPFQTEEILHLSKKIVRENGLPRLLIVEDNKINSDLIRRYLTNVVEVDIANTYEEAVEKIQANLYDVYLLDIHLGDGPGGVELAEQLRENYDSPIILAITGYATTESKQAIKDAGFTDLLIKPFRPQHLVSFIRRYV